MRHVEFAGLPQTGHGAGALEALGGALLFRDHPLQVAQLIGRVVATPKVPGLNFLETGLLGLADVADVARAAGMEHAARRRIGMARDLPRQPDARPLLPRSRNASIAS